MNIGEFIYLKRKELGLTLEEVGNFVGVSKSTVKKWETGYISNMKRDKIALLANVLKVNPAQFINDDVNENPPVAADEDAEDIVILNRSGEIIRKKMSKSNLDLLAKMIEALPDDSNPDL